MSKLDEIERNRCDSNPAEWGVYNVADAPIPRTR